MEVIAKRKSETPEQVFAEPLGNLFFRFHLMESNCLELQMCINEVNELEYRTACIVQQTLCWLDFGACFSRSILFVFLASCVLQNCLLFFLQVEEYDKIPPSKYRAKLARQIIHKYIRDGARNEIALNPLTRLAILKQFNERQACNGLFFSAKQTLLCQLRISCFNSFLYSKYYRRLLSFRKHGQTSVHTPDFDFLRVLGEGGFGKVFAVTKKDTKAVYACKTMSKAKIAERQRESLIMNERNILVTFI